MCLGEFIPELMFYIFLHLSSDPGNPGRGYDESVDLTEALKNHYYPELAISKLVEVHNCLKKDTSLTKGDKAKLGWERAYNLTTWEEFPGEALTVSGVILSRLGIKSGGGNSEDAAEEAKVMREIVRRASSLMVSED